jgi:hypothetical protein
MYVLCRVVLCRAVLLCGMQVLILALRFAQGRFSEAGFLMPRIVTAAAMGWSDAKKADEIQSFFTANPCPEADRAIKQVLKLQAVVFGWFVAS